MDSHFRGNNSLIISNIYTAVRDCIADASQILIMKEIK
jgi:hypothetical protein